MPQVVVNATYAVGSRMEAVGRTGLAHLFEHLMFMGTRRAPRGAFDLWMAEAGGRNNAGTEADQTEYYDVGPSRALPLLLWLEADRMGELGRLIDQEKLDLQREVVLNERRETAENHPYGLAELRLPELLWPEGHPYHHPVIGKPVDLHAATVPEVKDFFATWYDAANASLVVAGDFDATKVQGSIERLFGSIPSRGRAVDPGAPGFGDKSTTLRSVLRETVPDNVEFPRVILAWQSPKHFAPGDAEMDLLGSVLASGKESRLSEALVYEEKVAQDVSATQQSRQLASEFVVEATALSGVEPAKLEKALLEQIGRLCDKGVSTQELERVRNGFETTFVEGLQSIETRAALLNLYQTELGDPGYVQRDLDRYRHATADDLMKYAKKVLLPGAMVVLTIVPNRQARR